MVKSLTINVLIDVLPWKADLALITTKELTRDRLHYV